MTCSHPIWIWKCKLQSQAFLPRIRALFPYLIWSHVSQKGHCWHPLLSFLTQQSSIFCTYTCTVSWKNKEKCNFIGKRHRLLLPESLPKRPCYRHTHLTMYNFHNSTDTLKFWTEKWAIKKTFLYFIWFWWNLVKL